MADADTVELMLEAVDLWGLEFPPACRSLSIGEMCSAYNGIGPEWFPAEVRERIDDIVPALLPMAFVHDCEWHTADGSREAFDESNERLYRNGVICAKASYPWYHWRRYLTMYEASVCRDLCNKYGWSAYQQASQTNKGVNQ